MLIIAFLITSAFLHFSRHRHILESQPFITRRAAKRRAAARRRHAAAAETSILFTPAEREKQHYHFRPPPLRFSQRSFRHCRCQWRKWRADAFHACSNSLFTPREAATPPTCRRRERPRWWERKAHMPSSTNRRLQDIFLMRRHKIWWRKQKPLRRHIRHFLSAAAAIATPQAIHTCFTTSSLFFRAPFHEDRWNESRDAAAFRRAISHYWADIQWSWPPT